MKVVTPWLNFKAIHLVHVNLLPRRSFLLILSVIVSYQLKKYKIMRNKGRILTMNFKGILFRKYIFLPQDHGSWVFIFSPLLIGLFAGKQFSFASLLFIITAMTAFLIRQPIVMLIKTYSGRRPKIELPAACFWTTIYGFILLSASISLVFMGNGSILLLSIPAFPVFAWHLFLISKRDERRQAGIEILATGVLALAAPAAYWIGKGTYFPKGWILWILTWFQSSASIVYAYLRLEQRQWSSLPKLLIRLHYGKKAIAYTFFNLIISIIFGVYSIVPGWLWIAFIIQFFETIYGSISPAIRVKPVSIGIRQLIITTIFTIIFIIFWR